MKTKLESISSTKKQIKIDLTKEEVDSYFDSAYKAVGKKANLKGFRKGKVPAQVLDQYYASDIAMEALNQTINGSYPKALAECQLHPISDPRFDIKPLTKGADYSYDAVVEIIPEFEIQNYKGIALKKKDVKVEDDEIDKSLKNIQESKAQLGPVDENAALEKGLMAQLTIDGLIDGKSFQGGSTKGYVVEIGAGRLFEDFEKAIVGMKKGESREFDVVLPEHTFEESLKGKTAHFKVVLDNVHSKQLLNLDDDFAKDLGKESLAALKDEIKSEIQKRKESSHRNEYANSIIEHVAASYKFDLPEGLVKHQMEHSPDVKKEDVEKRLRMELVFQRIAEAEKVEVAPTDLEKRLREIAMMTGKQLPEVHKHYREQDRLRQLWLQLRFEKTVDLLIEQAKYD